MKYLILTIVFLLSGCTTQFAVFGLPEQPTTAKAIARASAKQCKDCQKIALKEYDKSVKVRNADEKKIDEAERDRIKHECDAEVVDIPGPISSQPMPDPTNGPLLPESGTVDKFIDKNCRDGKCK